MHPEVNQEKPGLCPECGMNLIPTQKSQPKAGPPPAEGEARLGRRAEKTEHKEHGKHAGHSTNIFKRKFWVSLILSIPVVLYSDIAQTLLKLEAPTFPGSRFVPLILASIIFFYGGWVFLASAWRELKAKLPGMMTLISLAITTAYTYSVYVVFIGEGKTLFWELATLITVMLLGHWMEMKAVKSAQGALKELSKLLPDTAEVLRGNQAVVVPLSEVKENDIILVKPGGKIPTDGIVVEGNSEVDESLATGESKPVAKSADSEMIAGTINGDGSLKIKVTKIGEKTFLAGVMRLVAEAQASKSRLQMLSDRAAFYLTAVAIITGTITFAAWLASEAGTAFAIERLVAVLVIACPHALGLAIPLVASISTTKAANNGFLVRQRMALEAARKIDVVLFDKTGTLTKGEYGVDEIIPVSRDQMPPPKADQPRAEESKVLQLAASVNAYSEHPIAKTIVKEAQKQNLDLLEAKNFQRIPGKGARAEIAGREILVGSETLFQEIGKLNDETLKSKINALAKQGKTIIYVIVNGQLSGVIALADVIREESREALTLLKKNNIKTAMITGDSEDVASWVAKELGIDEYFAKVLPEQKTDKIKILQQKGFKVAMVGDGINDAPALTQADLGIAIGAGTNVAIESAGIVLVRNDPRDIPKIIRLSQLTYSKMIQNLFWAAGYNVIAIPLAAGVLVSKGILLQPALAALLMSLSTVIVAFNALLLRGKKLN